MSALLLFLAVLSGMWTVFWWALLALSHTTLESHYDKIVWDQNARGVAVFTIPAVLVFLAATSTLAIL